MLRTLTLEAVQGRCTYRTILAINYNTILERMSLRVYLTLRRRVFLEIRSFSVQSKEVYTTWGLGRLELNNGPK